MLLKIGCQYRAVTGMIPPVCTWRQFWPKLWPPTLVFGTDTGQYAVPYFDFLTSRMVCRGKSDTWPSNVPSTQVRIDRWPTVGPTLLKLVRSSWPEVGPTSEMITLSVHWREKLVRRWVPEMGRLRQNMLV